MAGWSPDNKRTTCLRCEQAGVTTQLEQTFRGGICPVHEPDLISGIRTFALAILGLPPRPVLADRGKSTIHTETE